MAPPKFPAGMTLYSIGYAALKFPDLPSQLRVPLRNQVAALQNIMNVEKQNHQVAQIASQYLPSLLEYQSSDAAVNDRSSPQFYFSTVLTLLNFLNMNPDVCKSIAEHPTLMRDVITKLLDYSFEKAMHFAYFASQDPVIDSYIEGTFRDDLGSLLQFISTIMLWRAYNTMHPRFMELKSKLVEWERKYRDSPISTYSNRIIIQLDMAPSMIAEMKEMQRESLSCGVATCHGQPVLFCAACKIQRYCGREHQREDWKYHKNICMKGLVEEGMAENA